MVNAVNKAYNSDDNDELHKLALAISELQPGKLTVKGLNCMWDGRYIYAADLVKEIDLVEDEEYNTELAKWQKRYSIAPNGQLAKRYPASYSGLVSLLYDRYAARLKQEKKAKETERKAAKLAKKVADAFKLLQSVGISVETQKAA